MAERTSAHQRRPVGGKAPARRPENGRAGGREGARRPGIG